jgi:hypothetical protein
MGVVIELQPLTTVCIETANMEMVQDLDKVTDTKRFDSCTICVEAFKVSGGQLEIEGSDSLGGLFDVLDDPITAAARTTYIMVRRSDNVGSSTRLPRYIRWRAVDGGAGTLEICFRITCTFK